MEPELLDREPELEPVDRILLAPEDLDRLTVPVILLPLLLPMTLLPVLLWLLPLESLETDVLSVYL
ncbi:MAG TPA: hypothetical protein VFG01_05000, partial [Acidobacteriota bacterium]|nr:hypothetical protein [Acidobacteriota bacterium]